MPLRLVASDRFADHVTPPGHPERPERAEVFDLVVSRWMGRGAVRLDPRPASREDLARVHGAAYLDTLAATSGRAVSLDPDTYTSPGSYEVAVLGAGGACLAVDSA